MPAVGNPYLRGSYIALSGELGLESIEDILTQLEPVWKIPLPMYPIHIDLQGVTFVYPSALTLLTATILDLRHRRFEVSITRPQAINVDNYLTRMNFYELANIHSEYPWPRRDPSGRFRELAQIQDEKEVNEAAGDMFRIIQQNIEGIGHIRDALSYALLEVVENVFHHARSPIHAVVCAQSYPQLRQVELAVADTGRGISASLRDNPKLLNRFRTDTEAIQLAVQPKVTGRPSNNAGEGLFFTLEFIKQNGGDGYIYSYTGALQIRNGRPTPKSVPFWRGTWVALRFRTDRAVNTAEIFNRYAPPDKNYEWIEEEIPF